jgi:hypothetical protein
MRVVGGKSANRAVGNKLLTGGDVVNKVVFSFGTKVKQQKQHLQFLEKGDLRMATKVGINGFGRIGRAVARIIMERKGDLEIVAVNDLSDARSLAHLFKYDTVMGKWGGTVEAGDGELVIKGCRGIDGYFSHEGITQGRLRRPHQGGS